MLALIQRSTGDRWLVAVVCLPNRGDALCAKDGGDTLETRGGTNG